MVQFAKQLQAASTCTSEIISSTLFSSAVPVMNRIRSVCSLRWITFCVRRAFCVFDVVGFIDNHHVKFESLIYLQITGRFKIRDRNTAILLPILKSVHAPCTMNLCHTEFALFCNLLAPVGHNAGRGNNNKMGCTCVPQ